MVKNKTHEITQVLNQSKSTRKKCTLHLFVPYLSIVTRYGITVLLMLKQLDDIHNEAARIITGGTKLCSQDKHLSDLGWDSLHERRTKHNLIIFYKIFEKLTPPYMYLQDFVPPLVQEAIPYRLRNSNDIRTIHANTNMYNNQCKTGITYPKKLKSPAQLHHLNINSEESTTKILFCWVKARSNQNCLGQFREIPWNQTTYVHRGSSFITRVTLTSRKPC